MPQGASVTNLCDFTNCVTLILSDLKRFCRRPASRFLVPGLTSQHCLHQHLRVVSEALTNLCASPKGTHETRNMNQRAVTLKHGKTCHHLVYFGFQGKDVMQLERKIWGFKETCSCMKSFRPFFLGLPRDGSSHFSVLWIQRGKHWETQPHSTGCKCSEANPGLWIQEAVHQLKVKMGF